MSKVQPNQYEIQAPPYLNNLEVLQQARFEAACLQSAAELKRVFSHDETEDPAVAITRVTTESSSYDAPNLDAAALMSLEAVLPNTKLVTDSIFDSNTPDFELLTTVFVGSEELTIAKYSTGMTLQLNKIGYAPDGIPQTAELITDQVKQRFARSPGHRGFAQAVRLLAQMEAVPETVSSKAFDPTEDVLGTLAFLESVGLLRTGNKAFIQDYQTMPNPAALLEAQLAAVPDYRAKREIDDDATTYTWGRGAIRTLIIDKHTGSYAFSVSQDPASYYLETANQASDRAEVPFIETECAKQLCNVLDSAGLMFHPELQAEMTSPKESDRYGSVYTQLSREIAKWVNSPQRTKLSNLVVPVNYDYYGAALLKRGLSQLKDTAHSYDNNAALEDDAQESAVRGLWANSDRFTTSESAAALLSLIDQSLGRDQTEHPESQLPVTNKKINICDGACFDVIGYYFGAATEPFANKGLRRVAPNGVPLIEKTLGSHTYMTTEPTLFNGVRLPKGALLKEAEDGWAFLRLTAFSFDRPDDQQAAAGSELTKALANEAAAVRQLGGTLLRHLVTS